MAESNATRLADIQRTFGVDVHVALRVQDVLAGRKVDASTLPRCRKHNMLKLAVAHYYCEACAAAGEAIVGPASAHVAIPENVYDIARGLADFLEHSGALHEDDCSMDDTCSCCYARENAMANAAAKLLDALSR